MKLNFIFAAPSETVFRTEFIEFLKGIFDGNF